VQIRELTVPNSYEVTPVQWPDDRGLFLEWYRFDKLEAVVGHSLDLKQANLSVSRRGSVRGIHFADFPGSQAKYVTAPKGAVLDFVVDIRVGSPTFGSWDSVLLDDVDHRAVYIGEGLGHAFVALTEGAVVTYLVSDVFNPDREHGINAADPAIGLAFPLEASELLFSAKDIAAPTLAEMLENNALPTMDQANEHLAALRKGV
jgi:dTDP-4-dehydrorhamnose 3,5-epimerase